MSIVFHPWQRPGTTERNGDTEDLCGTSQSHLAEVTHSVGCCMRRGGTGIRRMETFAKAERKTKSEQEGLF